MAGLIKKSFMACLCLLISGCNASQVEQDLLPSQSEDKFSTLLKSYGFNVPVRFELSSEATTPASTTTEATTTQHSLWDMIKDSFKEYQRLRAEEDINSNSVFPQTTRLTSAWDWAFKPPVVTETDVAGNDTNEEPIRRVAVNTQPLLWNTARVVGTMGRGLLSSWMAQNVAAPSTQYQSMTSPPYNTGFPVVDFYFGLADAYKTKLRDKAKAYAQLQDNKVGSFRNSFLPKSSTGWGRPVEPAPAPSPSPVIVLSSGDPTQIERLITAKLTIIRQLLSIKLRLTEQLLTSTVPAAIQAQLNIVNTLLKVIANQDFSVFFKTLRNIRRTLWRANVNFFKALTRSFLRTTEKPTVSGGYEYGTPTPATPVWTPSPTLPPPTPYKLYYASPDPSPTYGTPSSEYGANLRNPLTSYPVYSAPAQSSSYSNFESQPPQTFATLPPVYIPSTSQSKRPFSLPILPGALGGSGAVVVSGDFLRQIMGGGGSVTKADISNESHTKVLRSSDKEEKRFSTQLLLSGFDRT